MSSTPKELTDEAVVLRTFKSGESDRVVVLWTRHHGKLRALAKGVRKTSSRMGGSLEPMSHVRVELVKGRGDLYITKSVAHLERLMNVRSDYARIAAGLAVVEVVDAIPTDEAADEGIFEMLVRVLLTLDNTDFYPDLIAASFFFKLLAYDGSQPVVQYCVNCQSPGPLVAFNAEVGGALCIDCRSGSALSSQALLLIRRILGGDLAGVLREENAPGSGEVMTLAHDAIEAHFGKRLRVSRSTVPLAPHLEPPRP
ncbi:MAG: DNA repair protein RecO [Acidimicrobiaceae bacterium]|nr:DNA repair protein RecO [Acidimicrobiaceae bacterium]